MKVFYIYCIVKDPPGNELLPGGSGIEPGAAVMVRRYRDIGAVFSLVPLEIYNAEAFHQKVLDDLSWVDQKARLHTFILEQILEKKCDLVPLRFFTIFSNGQSINDMLRRRYEQLVQLLSRVKDKLEWSIKVFCCEQKLLEACSTPAQQRKDTAEAGMSKTGRGRDYLNKKLTEKKMQAHLHGRLLFRIEHVAGEIRRVFEDFCVEDCYEGGGENAPKGRKMVYNCSVLVNRSDAPRLKELLEGLNAPAGDDGLSLELSGPWPPYSFTALDLESNEGG